MVIRQEPPVVVDDAAVAALAARYGIQELALFGSVLRDDFTPASDVDVLVTFAPDSPVRGLLDFIGVKHDLEALFQRPVDLVEPHTLDPYIRDAVVAEKHVIYVAASR
jgi:predicted nucleotidyltransferase